MNRLLCALVLVAFVAHAQTEPSAPAAAAEAPPVASAPATPPAPKWYERIKVEGLAAGPWA
jgi:hypothetical protein